MYMPDVVETTVQTTMNDPTILEQVVDIDNRVWYMDIFGSWVEFGMVIAAIAVGMAFVILTLKSYIKKKLDRKSFSLKMPDSCFWNVHTRINESLTELRVKCDSARVQLVQFHNTGYFLDGISMKKMSLTHESLRNGISSEMNIKKDLLLSMCVDGLTLLTKDVPVLYMTEQLEDSWCKQLFQNSNVMSFMFLPLRKRNQIVGYVMCQWCSMSKIDQIDEVDCAEEINQARNLIEVQMEQENKGRYYNV